MMVVRIPSVVGLPLPCWLAINRHGVRDPAVPNDVFDPTILAQPQGLRECASVTAVYRVMRNIEGRDDTHISIAHPRIVI